MSQNTFDLVLNKSVKGSLKNVLLGFCITDIGDDEQDCYLYKLEVKGGPSLQFDEWELKPQNKTFKGDQTWNMGLRTYTEEDDDGNEKEAIVVKSVALKTTKDGKSMAKVELGKNGEDVLTTEDWKD